MRKLPILFFASVSLAGCSGGQAGNNASASNASAAAPGAANCDMAEVGQRSRADGSGRGDPREQARLYEAMVQKAGACAAAAGFTNLGRFGEMGAGTSRMDQAGVYHARQEAEWIGYGMRGGVRMQIVITASGVLSSRPAQPDEGPRPH